MGQQRNFKGLKEKSLLINILPTAILKIRGITSVVKADSKIPEVMAASIMAKVWRDKHMMRLHDEHPIYGWQSNKGYGTKYHIAALRKHGMTKYHRSVFVRTALSNSPSNPSLNLREGRYQFCYESRRDYE